MKHFSSIVFILALASLKFAAAQDAHFSQFYQAPLLVNPARAGFFNGNYRLQGVYRSQWKEVTMPFKSLTGTADLSLPVGENKNNILGIAITSFADKAGDADYSNNEINLTFSYHKSFGTDHHHFAGFGISTGFANTTYDYTKMIFDENYQNGTNTEPIPFSRAHYIDLSAGAEYNFLDDKSQYNFGVAVFHLNRPALDFFGSNDGSFVYRKIAISAGAAKSLSKTMELQPHAVFFLQGPRSEVMVGTDLKILLIQNNISHYSVYFGGYYRFGDALVPSFRIDMNDLSFGLSYDFTTSKLSAVNQSSGGPELSITYIGKFKGSTRTFNPRF